MFATNRWIEKSWWPWFDAFLSLATLVILYISKYRNFTLPVVILLSILFIVHIYESKLRSITVPAANIIFWYILFSSQLPQASPSLLISAIGIVVLAFAFLQKNIFSCKKKSFLYFAVFTSSFLGFIALKFFETFPNFLVMLLVVTKGFVWYFLLILKKPPPVSWRASLRTITMALPIWTQDSRQQPVPAGSNRDSIDLLEKKELSSIKYKGYRIIFISLLTLVANDALLKIVFHTHPTLSIFNNLPSLGIDKLDNGFMGAIEKHDSFWQRWMLIIGIFLKRYLNMAVMMGISVGIARLLGFDAQAPVQAPWKANSFSNFYGRIMFYYSHLIIDIFYEPIRGCLRPLKHFRFFRPIVFFFVFFVGGLLFHSVRDLSISTENQFFVSSTAYREWPYFLLIGFAIAVSSGPESRRRGKMRGPVSQFGFCILYLMGWSLIYSLYVQTHYIRGPWQHYFHFVQGLVPGLE